jgi:hypothetical protein
VFVKVPQFTVAENDVIAKFWIAVNALKLNVEVAYVTGFTVNA